MRKIFVYRKHIYKIKKFGFIGLLILSTITFVMGLILLMYPLYFVALFLFAEALLLNYAYGRFTKVRVILDDDGITYINHKGGVKIPYSDILKLKTPSIRYIGGWLKIKTSDDTIRLTVVIENIQELIYELKRQLDLREQSDTYNEKKLFSFMKTAMYSDMSWSRLYRIFWKLIGTIVINFIVLVAFALIFNITKYLDLLFTIEMLVVTVIYLGSEIYFGRLMSKQISHFEVRYNDLEFENKVYKKVYFIGFLTLLLTDFIIIIYLIM